MPAPLARLFRVASLGLALVAIVAARPAFAEDPAQPAAATPATPWGDALPLVRSYSWAGWDYGPDGNRGWTLIGPRFTASKGSAPLLSGWSFADFELTFDAVFASGGKLELRLPRVPNGAGLSITLNEGPGCGRIALEGSDQPSFAGAELAASPDGAHQFTITRCDATISVSVDGKPLGSASINPVRRFGLGLAVIDGDVAIENLAAREPKGEPLVTRDDLADWWTPGNKASWKVENGELVCLNQNGNYLRVGREFGNFVIAFDYLIKKGGNSGIGIRTPRDGWPSGEGMEMQIMDEKATNKISRHSPMAIYGNLEPLGRADKSEEWNRVVIKADGWMISAWVNGVLVQHANTKRLPELSHRFLKGWIGFQDHSDWVRYKNLTVTTARDGEGLDAWQAAKTEPPSREILDRVMNLERLADPNLKPTTTRVVTALAGKERREILKLDGPGALVGWSIQDATGTPSKGKIALAFDGETKPRLECSPGDVAKRLAPVGESGSPIYTFASFAHGLAISARELPEDATVIVETIAFDSPVESWRPDDPGVARGLYPAITYRREQGGWGKIRDHDPDKRIFTPACDLAPGERKELVSVEGSGVMQWLALVAPPELLANEDLWIEIAIDGESTPAVATPARFYFPGLEEGKRFENFLVTTSGPAIVNRLPAPYSTKLSLTLVNRGEKPIKSVGLRTCYSPRPAEETARLWRLRGTLEDESRDLEKDGRIVLMVESGAPLAERGASVRTLLAAPKASEEFAGTASGFRKNLSWRMFLLAPTDLESVWKIITNGPASGPGPAGGKALIVGYYPPAKK